MSVKIENLFSSDHELTAKLKKWHKQPWRTYYSLFVSKSEKMQQKYLANIAQKKHVATLWDIFLAAYFKSELEHFELKAKQNLKNKKIIWQYWGQGLETSQLPDLVKLCFASVDQYCGDYQIIRLDEDTVRDYLDLPDFVWQKKSNSQFKPAFFADLIRLALLDVYGGVWIDATILLTAPIPAKILEQDVFMFHRHPEAEQKEFWHHFNDNYFGWHTEHYVNVLNSFIVGKKGNEVIHTCLDIMLNYWKTQNNIPHYFIFQIMFNELMRDYLVDQPMILLDDTLVHLLQVRQSEQFNQKIYDEIAMKTSIHKLNYIKESVSGSYYDYLSKQYMQ